MVIISRENLPKMMCQNSSPDVKMVNKRLFNTTTTKNGSYNVPSFKSMKRYAARLRNLRWKIYHEEKKSNVKSILDKYKIPVGEILDLFKTRLKLMKLLYGKKN